MDQYAESPGHSTHCCMETLHPLSTSSIVARHLLYLMVQGKVTMTVHLDATPSTLSLPPAPHLHHPPILCRVPFLRQPSQFFLAWDRHRIMLALILGGFVYEKLDASTYI